MKKKLSAMFLVFALVLSLITPALAFDSSKYQDDRVLLGSDLTAITEGLYKPADAAAPVTEQQAVDFLLCYAGLTENQLNSTKGVYNADDWNAMAKSVGMLKGVDYAPTSPCTAGVFNSLSKNSTALYNAMHAEKKAPLFVDGMAQPIFAAEDMVRYCVYVESNYDTDDDGKLDLVKALVQLPGEVLDGMKVPTIFEARPYIAGMNPYTGAGENYGSGSYDMTKLHAKPAPRTPVGAPVTTAAAVAAATEDDWNYIYNEEAMYEDLGWYDYYTVRGFAVVESAGIGTKGSEGFETCGGDVEIDAFKCIIEWLTGDRAAYTDLTGNHPIAADWSTGNVGMTGRSYAGTTQFGIATTGVKGLKTVVPVAGIASWYEYTNSQGITTEDDVNYLDTLAWYCNSRYEDKADWAKIKEKYGNYQTQLKNDQLATNGNYSPTWANRDYTLDWAKIKCPALIVHGLNDENVRTKEFDLMYDAFTKAGQNTKLLLHQGTHLTPAYPAKGYELYTGELLYNDILNQWFSHYLYGVENGVEKMPTVTAQSNVDGSQWNHYDSWKTGASAVLPCNQGAKSSSFSANVRSQGIFNKEGEEPNVSYGKAWKDEFINATPAGVACSSKYTMPVTSEMTIGGPVAVHINATTSAIGPDKDAVQMSAMLVDIGPEPFLCYNATKSYLPLKTLKTDGAWMGGGVENYNLVAYQQTAAPYKIIAYGWMDLYNPDAGYASSTAAKRTQLEAGKYEDYTLYLQPNLYTVPAGHTLALVIYAKSSGSEDYTITINNEKTFASLPLAARPISTSASPVVGNPFTDIQKGDYCYDAVLELYRRSVVQGTSETVFSPASGLTRAQVITMLYRLAGSPAISGENPFTDISKDSFCADAVLWAAKNGIAFGNTPTTFAPNAPVTREQLVTFLYRYAMLKNQDVSKKADLSTFTDCAAVGTFAAPAMAWAVGNGIVSGASATTLAPQSIANRGQAAAILYRYSQLGAKA